MARATSARRAQSTTECPRPTRLIESAVPQLPAPKTDILDDMCLSDVLKLTTSTHTVRQTKVLDLVFCAGY